MDQIWSVIGQYALNNNTQAIQKLTDYIERL